ncbi:hypothetical protein [Nocardia nova]|jgi:hypothetical protein|uniref:hypothetical protein n=1 Tax=Nocardia nova TaxID=37330 RepID=UPI0007A49B81|nr:hypothetical protein [Nocardia nova]
MTNNDAAAADTPQRTGKLRGDATAPDVMQLNARVPRTVAVGAKRLARQRGMTLNDFITELITRELMLEADALRKQMDEEERRAAEEYAAMREFLDNPAQFTTRDTTKR